MGNCVSGAEFQQKQSRNKKSKIIATAVMPSDPSSVQSFRQRFSATAICRQDHAYPNPNPHHGYAASRQIPHNKIMGGYGNDGKIGHSRQSMNRSDAAEMVDKYTQIVSEVVNTPSIVDDVAATQDKNGNPVICGVSGVGSIPAGNAIDSAQSSSDHHASDQSSHLSHKGNNLKVACSTPNNLPTKTQRKSGGRRCQSSGNATHYGTNLVNPEKKGTAESSSVPLQEAGVSNCRGRDIKERLRQQKISYKVSVNHREWTSLVTPDQSDDSSTRKCSRRAIQRRIVKKGDSQIMATQTEMSGRQSSSGARNNSVIKTKSGSRTVILHYVQDPSASKKSSAAADGTEIKDDDRKVSSAPSTSIESCSRDDANYGDGDTNIDEHRRKSWPFVASSSLSCLQECGYNYNIDMQGKKTSPESSATAVTPLPLLQRHSHHNHCSNPRCAANPNSAAAERSAAMARIKHIAKTKSSLLSSSKASVRQICRKHDQSGEDVDHQEAEVQEVEREINGEGDDQTTATINEDKDPAVVAADNGAAPAAGPDDEAARAATIAADMNDQLQHDNDDDEWVYISMAAVRSTEEPFGKNGDDGNPAAAGINGQGPEPFYGGHRRCQNYYGGPNNSVGTSSASVKNNRDCSSSRGQGHDSIFELHEEEDDGHGEDGRDEDGGSRTISCSSSATNNSKSSAEGPRQVWWKQQFSRDEELWEEVKQLRKVAAGQSGKEIGGEYDWMLDSAIARMLEKLNPQGAAAKVKVIVQAFETVLASAAATTIAAGSSSSAAATISSADAAATTSAAETSSSATTAGS